MSVTCAPLVLVLVSKRGLLWGPVYELQLHELVQWELPDWPKSEQLTSDQPFQPRADAAGFYPLGEKIDKLSSEVDKPSAEKFLFVSLFWWGKRLAPWALSIDWLYSPLDIQQLGTTVGTAFFLSRLKVLRVCPFKPLEQAGVRWLSIKTAFYLCHQFSKVCRSDTLHPNSTCAIGLWLSLSEHMVWPPNRVPLEDIQYVLQPY